MDSLLKQLGSDVGVELFVQRFESLPGLFHFLDEGVGLVGLHLHGGTVLVAVQPGNMSQFVPTVVGGSSYGVG